MRMTRILTRMLTRTLTRMLTLVLTRLLTWIPTRMPTRMLTRMLTRIFARAGAQEAVHDGGAHVPPHLPLQARRARPHTALTSTRSPHARAVARGGGGALSLRVARCRGMRRPLWRWAVCAAAGSGAARKVAAAAPPTIVWSALVRATRSRLRATADDGSMDQDR